MPSNDEDILRDLKILVEAVERDAIINSDDPLWERHRQHAQHLREMIQQIEDRWFLEFAENKLDAWISEDSQD